MLADGCVLLAATIAALPVVLSANRHKSTIPEQDMDRKRAIVLWNMVPSSALHYFFAVHTLFLTRAVYIWRSGISNHDSEGPSGVTSDS